MTDLNYTHITLVADRSGSMDVIRTDAEGAINTFIDEQKQAPGRATFTLVQFDSQVDTMCDHVDIQAVEPYRLHPRGTTALLDAWGRSMVGTGEFLASLEEDQRPGHVIFVVVTDGHENASREFTSLQIKAMTERQRNEYSWDVVFLAANMDAVQVGQIYGVSPDSSLTYGANALGAQNSYDALNDVVLSVRSGTTTGVKFSGAQRKAAKG